MYEFSCRRAKKISIYLTLRKAIQQFHDYALRNLESLEFQEREFLVTSIFRFLTRVLLPRDSAKESTEMMALRPDN